jgi:hypothetical protein
MPFDTGIFLADLFGCLLALPIALFLAFWMSAIKRRAAVIVGAFIGALIGFFIILFWASQIPNVIIVGAFFGALVFCAALGLAGGMLTDLLIGRVTERDYRRVAHEQH